MPYGLSVTAWCVLFSIILPFCFSEQDLLDILLVRHSVDYYHCDCRPNLQTTTAVQLQIARWVTAVNIQSHPFVSFRNAPKKWKYQRDVYSSIVIIVQLSILCVLQFHILALSIFFILVKLKARMMFEYFLGARYIFHPSLISLFFRRGFFCSAASPCWLR